MEEKNFALILPHFPPLFFGGGDILGRGGNTGQKSQKTHGAIAPPDHGEKSFTTHTHSRLIYKVG